MVCQRHMLCITKEWKRQIDPLDVDDFASTLTAMAAVNAFAFYNCGEKSGAS